MDGAPIYRTEVSQRRQYENGAGVNRSETLGAIRRSLLLSGTCSLTTRWETQ